MPDLDLVEKALRQAELVIVQDAYHPTETPAFADVLLPAAQWPEKDGVMTNSERRLTYLPKLVEPPGEALPDAEIFTRFAAEMGWKARFPSARSAEIFDEFAALTARRPVRLLGRQPRATARGGPAPVAGAARRSSRHRAALRRRRASRHADGRARFVAGRARASPSRPPTRDSRSRSPRGACAITGTR